MAERREARAGEGVVVSIDGEVVTDPGRASVSVFDRGFLYGDSVFEVLRVYDGHVFRRDAHLARLARSAAIIGIAMPVPPEQLADELAATLAQARLGDAYVRVVVTRGTGPLDYDPRTAGSATRVVIVAPPRAPADEAYACGVGVRLVRASRPAEDERTSGAKTSNYLTALLATRHARELGAHEAVVVDAAGRVREGVTSNVFLLRAGELITPDLEGILEGITRAAVLELAARDGLRVFERPTSVEELLSADEAFLTSTLREVLPVVRVDDAVIGTGRVGPTALRLRALLQGEVEAERRRTGGGAVDPPHENG